MSLSINFEVKQKVSKSLFNKIKNKVLGEEFFVSLVFVNEKRIQELNRTYRKINKPTDVLSFTLDKKFGEIFICSKVADKKSSQFELSEEEYLIKLFIHALLHLKGFEHSSRMDIQEDKFFNLFSTQKKLTNGKKNTNRNRHRDISNKSCCC